MKSRPQFRFRLYVAGDSPNSTLAICNLNAICEKHLAGRHEIEIVDVLLHPKRALDEGIVLTPTLIRVSPTPLRKIFGNLSQTETAMVGLGLPD
jgi:circadian clock protein KaiB